MMALQCEMKSMLLWSLRLMRALGLAPYKCNNGNCVKSQVRLGFSISMQNLIFISVACRITDVVNGYSKNKSDVYFMIRDLYGLFYYGMMMLISFHFLTSSAHVVRIVRYLNDSSTSPKSVSRSQYISAGLIVITVCQQIYRSSMDHYAVSMSKFILGCASNLIYISYLGLPFIFHSLIKLFTLDLRQSTSHIIYWKNNTCFEAQQFQDDANEDFVERDLANIWINLIRIRRVITETQKAFSGVVLGVIAIDQYQLVLAVLFASYDTISQNSVISSLFYTFPTALQLYLILDSQTEYLKVCEEGVKRVTRLTAAAGCTGTQNWKTVWQLRGIKAGLKSMPRFSVFGLFELGRHCLLSMGSIALTYVIIAVQFTTSNSPVTCKAFA
ncbi:Gustatory receptor 4, partial [Hyalella azteca]